MKRLRVLFGAVVLVVPFACSDDSAIDAGPADVGVDGSTDSGPDASPPDVGLPDTEPDTPDTGPVPGIYPADVTDLQTCDDVCAEQMLTCNGRRVWSTFIVRLVGGGQAEYEGGGTDEFGCAELPATTNDSGSDIETYRCSCIVDPGGLINDVAVTIANRGVYQGPFTIAEEADVFYQMFDHYRGTPNRWKVAMVPAASVTEYLAGSEPLVYGEFEGSATRQTALLPAGDYELVVECRNEFASCTFSAFVDLEP